MFDELEEEPRVDLTPLIDVIFMLVIFFVMTMTIQQTCAGCRAACGPEFRGQEENDRACDQREVRRKVFL